jgi:hypothetical protein
MAPSSWSECPFCERVIGLTRSGKFYPHVPYASRGQAFFLDRGRRCLGSQKTVTDACAAAEERRKRIAESMARFGIS